MMTTETRDRLLGFYDAWDHPVTFGVTIGIGVLIVVSGGILWLGRKTGRFGDAEFKDAFGRWKSWTWLSVGIVVPVLLGAAWTIAAVTLLSLGCYREFARATGLFRQRLISVAVVLGILILNFAVLDHFERLFFSMAPLTVALIAVITFPLDRPQGYVQRVALGTLGFLMFGFSLGYVGNIANSQDYRPLLLLMLLGVAMNDIFAYCTGKLLRGPKLLPITSPGKTISGAVGALLLTTTLTSVLGHYVFIGTNMDHPIKLIILGLLISSLGQLGDLVLSAIKRDIGIKDIGAVIPGHGGLLDRFDSLVLVPPAVYHFVSLNLGPLGGDQPIRILTGGWL
jgi:phosphatidate cytidylyltransferase